MSRRFLLVLLSGVILSASATSGSGGSAEPPAKSLLPPELMADAEIFPMARLSTSRRPMSFSPYSVADLKSGWTGSDSMSDTVPHGDARVGRRATTADQRFSFSLKQAGEPRWRCNCRWTAANDSIGYAGKTSSVDVPMSSTVRLECDLESPTGDRSGSIRWDADAAARGLGMRFVADGIMSLESSEFRISPLFRVRSSRLIGDVPVGYLFSRGESVVAAMEVHTGKGPGRFVVSWSLTEEDRSLLATGAAALVLNDRMVTAGMDDW